MYIIVLIFRSDLVDLIVQTVGMDGRIAVLGVLLEEGEENERFQIILDNVSRLEKEHNRDTGIKLIRNHC